MFFGCERRSGGRPIRFWFGAFQPLAKMRLRPGFAPTANHLWQEQHGLKDRAGRKSPGETAKELARFFVVVKPPKIGHERQTIDVNVLRVNQFEQPRRP